MTRAYTNKLIISQACSPDRSLPKRENVITDWPFLKIIITPRQSTIRGEIAGIPCDNPVKFIEMFLLLLGFFLLTCFSRPQTTVFGQFQK
jgi:hypothetical protein